MWALSRNNAAVHCYVFLATQQFRRRAYQQHCYARNNRPRDVSMVFGILLILSVVFENRLVQTCVCVWLWTPFGWKTEFVSGNCERSTCVWKLSDCKNES
jgi:hypothetical protein